VVLGDEMSKKRKTTKKKPARSRYGEGDLVMVEWLDSFGCSANWQEFTEIREPRPVICKSAGWLVCNGKKSKVILPHLADCHNGKIEQGCGDMTIPNACIRKITVLRKAKAKN
jgi:hypothetical protein